MNLAGVCRCIEWARRDRVSQPRNTTSRATAPMRKSSDTLPVREVELEEIMLVYLHGCTGARVFSEQQSLHRLLVMCL